MDGLRCLITETHSLRCIMISLKEYLNLIWVVYKTGFLLLQLNVSAFICNSTN